MSKKNQPNLHTNLKKITEISLWLENQTEVDLEKSLEKIKEGMNLIKISQQQLQNLTNEFEEIMQDNQTSSKSE